MDQEITDNRPKLYLKTPESDFVKPYFERLISDYQICDDIEGASAAVMISSTDVYDVESGLNFNELTPIKEDSKIAEDEAAFEAECAAHGLPATILRCAPIVCTGMTGKCRELAERIYRGRHFNIVGNDATMSVVHAVSLPDAAMAVIDKGGTYNVTDTHDSTISELADALAWRIGQKRVFSLSPKWFKILFGKRTFERQTHSLTFSCEKLRSAGAFEPVSVVEYLKTHVYDHDSL